MPLPLKPSPFVVSRFQRLFFHSSACFRAAVQNHYEVLHVSPAATPAEIKKAFYAHSKATHPDRNPDDPTAAERFIKISEAWAVLGTPAKRQAYDREHGNQNSQHGPGHHHYPRGSYSSSGPAGGRPASGLSRRRTQFRGPPPSFYRSGGWGQHSAKRRAAQDNGASGAEAPPQTEMGGGMGTGQHAWGAPEDVPHFDRRGHTKTHQNQDRRRQSRMSKHFIPIDESKSTLVNFVLVSGIVLLSVAIPSYIYDKMSSAGRPEKKSST